MENERLDERIMEAEVTGRLYGHGSLYLPFIYF